MNVFNLIAYFIYFIITFFITVKVGWICYKNGIHFIQEEFGDPVISQSANKLLLVGYYLLNLGYACIMIYSWQDIDSTHELIESISTKSAWIIISLGVMHYVNMTVIYIIRKLTKKNINHL